MPHETKTPSTPSRKSISILCGFLILMAVLSVVYGLVTVSRLTQSSSLQDEITLSEEGTYSTREELSAYLYKYGHLPANYITKEEAYAMGWYHGSIETFLPGYAIGGDRFLEEYNKSLNLPSAEGVCLCGRRSAVLRSDSGCRQGVHLYGILEKLLGSFPCV